MESTYKPEAKPEVVAPPAAEEPPVETPPPAEPEKGALASEAPPPPEPKASPTSTDYLAVVEVALRVILFAGTLVAVVVIVTGSQTKWIPSLLPPYRQRNSAKFNYSPAFIYFVAAHSVACLYSIITTLLSGLALLKPGFSKQIVSHFVLIDVVLLGIIASATGAAGGVAYIGLRGNNHSRWTKICDIYGTFCRHLAGASAASLFSSVVLVLLILLSVFVLSRKIPK